MVLEVDPGGWPSVDQWVQGLYLLVRKMGGGRSRQKIWNSNSEAGPGSSEGVPSRAPLWGSEVGGVGWSWRSGSYMAWDTKERGA